MPKDDCSNITYSHLTFLGYFCYPNEKQGQLYYCFGFIICESCFVYLLKKIVIKKKKVIEPQPGKSLEDTYNILTKYQIDILILLLVILMVGQIYTLTIVLMGEDVGIRVKENCTVSNGALFNVWHLFGYIEMLLLLIILMLQFSEWIFVNYMIINQDDRTVGEITFDHNAENVDEPILPGQVNFRRKEYRQWVKLVIFYVSFTSFLVGAMFICLFYDVL